MKRIILSGCCGKMGNTITNIVNERDDCKIVAGLDLITESSYDYPIFSNASDINIEADVIIDFSHPSVLEPLLKFALDKKMPVVLATTGYSDSQVEMIKEASENIPVFYSRNMSLGINLLISLAKKAVSILGNSFDIEVVEKHHNLKIDAPSGTALMIADAINEECDDYYKYEYDRHSKRKKRDKNEIGLHAIRGGTIVGEHDVIFAGHDEVITISHSAQSKGVFAAGSVNAAVFICGLEPKMYDMADLINNG